MILTGREMQALLGATLIYGDVPFIESVKPSLSAEEQKDIDAADAKLIAAKRLLKPAEPRNPETWQLMLCNEGEVVFTAAEARVLAKVAAACLVELKTDGDLSPFAGPRVGVDALRSAYEKITELSESLIPSSGRREG
jgi:hypothetical protein